MCIRVSEKCLTLCRFYWTFFCSMKEVHFKNLFFAASMEVIKEHRGVLLYVEDYRSLRSAETNQSSRGREQAETSVHSQLVSVL